MYSIYRGATKMYDDQLNVFQQNGMKRNIADFVAKCPNYQQVMVENQKPRGMTQKINIPTWKFEMIYMDLTKNLARTHRHHGSIWEVFYYVTKSMHFLTVKSTNLVEYYAKL